MSNFKIFAKQDDALKGLTVEELQAQINALKA